MSELITKILNAEERKNEAKAIKDAANGDYIDAETMVKMLREKLLNEMKGTGECSVDGEYHKAFLIKREKFVLTDEEAVPECFTRTVTAVNKPLLTKYLKSGHTTKYAHIENDYSLQIRSK